MYIYQDKALHFFNPFFNDLRESRQDRNRSLINNIIFVTRFENWIYFCIFPNTRENTRLNTSTNYISNGRAAIFKVSLRGVFTCLLGFDYLKQSDQRILYEPVREKTNNLEFRPGPTQTGLYTHRRWLEARNFGFRK